MGSLHYPPASLESSFCALVMGLFASLPDVRLIVPLDDCIRCRRALVARVGAKIVLSRSARHLHHDLVQRGFKQLYVMRVCAAGDERERDATNEERNLPAATSENANVQHWRCQTRAEEPSIGNQCATRKRWLKRSG